MPKISLSAIRAQFPQYANVSDQKLLIGLHKTMYPQLSAGEFYNAIDFDTERKPDAMDGMSGLDKVRANIGAGMMDLATGAQQLGADWFGSDEDSARMRQEVAEKRALDRHLADNTTGGTALQIAGGIIPTLFIPAGGLARTAQAARLLPQALNLTRGAGLAIDGGLAGGLYGTLQPVGENQSRAGNAAIGTALGAALPLALGAGKYGYQRFTERGAAQAAQEAAGAKIGAEVAGAGASRKTQAAALQQTLDRLKMNQTAVPPQHGIPLSTAAQMGDPQLARLEAGSRARNGANWFDFDQNQAAAVADAFRNATSEVGELASRQGTRQSNWGARWDWAKQGLSQPRFEAGVKALAQHLDDAMVSGESSNPAVRAMLQEVKSEIARLGDKFGPDNLQQIRANLSGKGNKMYGGPLAQAPRDAPATKRLLETIDGVLDDATNFRWKAAREGYAADSVGVNEARAAGRAREQYYDPANGRVLGTAADPQGTIPNITEFGLGNAINSGYGKTAQELSPTALTQLESILGALRQQKIVQGVKRSATAGGGSNTASDLMASQAARQFGAGTGAVTGGAAGAVAGDMAVGALQKATNRAGVLRDEVLARALQNPNEMLQLLEQQLARGEPLAPWQQALYQALHQAGGAASRASQQ